MHGDIATIDLNVFSFINIRDEHSIVAYWSLLYRGIV